MSELAVDGIPVTVTCRVLGLARQPYYRWRRQPVTSTQYRQAHVATAVFDADRDDPEFGYRLLADQAATAGFRVCERTIWRICADNGWWASFSTKTRGTTARKPTLPAHEDLVCRQFTASTWSTTTTRPDWSPT